jgi:hypothetical protein
MDDETFLKNIHKLVNFNLGKIELTANLFGTDVISPLQWYDRLYISNTSYGNLMTLRLLCLKVVTGRVQTLNVPDHATILDEILAGLPKSSQPYHPYDNEIAEYESSEESSSSD